MRLVTTPYILRIFYPSLLWKMPEGEKKIYLTFDDGPHHEITPQVLDLLEKFDAKATFFCIGKNVEANKDVFKMIVDDGHSIGNHTFNHDKGWKTKTEDYVVSVDKTNLIIKSPLLRPPYGKIKPSQIRKLKGNYKLIAWTVISYDWDKSLTSDDCYNNVIKNASDGSIIVFHDSEKAARNMIPALTKVLEYYSNKGFTFEKL